MNTLSLLILLACQVTFATELRHKLIPFGNKQKAEVYWQTPEGKGPFPVYILAYAFQGNFKDAAGMGIKYGILPELAKRGTIGVIFSQAGHGKSTGTPDHAGPLSREGLKATIKFIKSLPSVDREKIVLHGISMGAVLSALVASEIPDIKILILESGAYDTEAMMTRLMHESFSDPMKRKIYDMLDEQTGNLPDRYLTRSVIPVAFKIKASTLILAGAADSMGTASEALKLHEQIPGSRLRIFPFADHGIHRNDKGPEIQRFINEKMKE